MRIVLGGPMGTGKSTVGRLVAHRLNVPFVDLDEELGDIPARFAAEGESGFRDAETAALRRRATGDGVLAVGGGALVRPENRALLEGWTVLVLLANETTLAQRLGDGAGRPLASVWRHLLYERAPIWSMYGPPIWTDELDTTSVADVVIARCCGAPSR